MSRQLQLNDSVQLREWEERDIPSLLKHANNPEIAKNLRDMFPHPYTDDDARAWIAFNRTLYADMNSKHSESEGGSNTPLSDFAPGSSLHLAIEVDGEAAGGISILVGKDIERCACEIGYWLGESVWGRGVASAAVRALCKHVFDAAPQIARIFAVPFARNAASARVLEKCGFVREGVMRCAAVKMGVLEDLVLYALVRSQSHSAPLS